MRIAQSMTVPFFMAAFGLALTACNGGGDKQALTSDWINTPVAANPNPNPSATPTTNPIPPAGQLYTGPAEVAKYVQKFIDDAKAQGVDVTPNMQNPTLEIQISSLASYGSSVIGLCETSGNMRRVTFSPTFWNSVDETQRELVVHHELGHCVLNRPHRTDLLPSGLDASIMYPVIFSDATYLDNYAYYQNELYTYQKAGAGEVANSSTVYVCDQSGK